MDVPTINSIIEFVLAYKWWFIAASPFVIAILVLRR
jgi:hypothetical protein